MVAITPSGLKINDQEFAYIWELTWFGNESEFGPSISSVNETTITSGFCKPIEQEKHKYHERYKKLAELYEKI